MLEKLFAYNKKWADIRTLDAIFYVNKSVYIEEYKFALQQINHIVIVEELFKARLTNLSLPHDATNSSVVPEIDELKQRLILSNDWYQTYVRALGLEDKEMVLRIEFADGKKGSMDIEEILFHIVNHGSYHRGNIAHSLDLAKVAHPIDGYGIYIHQVEPERRN